MILLRVEHRKEPYIHMDKSRGFTAEFDKQKTQELWMNIPVFSIRYYTF